MRHPASWCPICGARTIPFIRGFPTPEDFAAEARGDVILGGCGVSPSDPTDVCTGDPSHALVDGMVVGSVDDVRRSPETEGAPRNADGS